MNDPEKQLQVENGLAMSPVGILFALVCAALGIVLEEIEVFFKRPDAQWILISIFAGIGLLCFFLVTR